MPENKLPKGSSQEPRIGVFVCRCGINIASTVAVPEVVDRIKDLPGVAYAGENLAAVLMAGGVLALRWSPRLKGARGVFCLMGVCQECLVRVNGTLLQACLVRVKDGLTIELEDRRL